MLLTWVILVFNIVLRILGRGRPFRGSRGFEAKQLAYVHYDVVVVVAVVVRYELWKEKKEALQALANFCDLAK